MRVLHVINGLFYGGGQRVVLDLVRGLPAVDGTIDVQLCSLGTGETPLAEAATDWVSYDGRYNRPGVIFHTARELRKVIERVRPEIVHTHGWDADLIGALALPKNGPTHVVHWHITPPSRDSWKARLRTRWMRSLFQCRRTRFIAVSDAVRQAACAHFCIRPDRVTTVRNGIDVEQFHKGASALQEKASRTLSAEPLILGTAARLAAMKGLEFLMQAMVVLRDRGVAVRWKIAGTGGARGRLDELAQSLGVASEVEFIGHVSDMPSFYREIDVFVLPSVSTEGLPLVVLEAMAMELPVVVTRLAGTPEAVRDEVDGLLVPPRDADALSNAVCRLAADRALRQTMGQHGRQRVLEAFTVEHVARGVVRVYQEALRGAVV